MKKVYYDVYVKTIDGQEYNLKTEQTQEDIIKANNFNLDGGSRADSFCRIQHPPADHRRFIQLYKLQGLRQL